jgi:hypothetical protein
MIKILPSLVEGIQIVGFIKEVDNFYNGNTNNNNNSGGNYIYT